MRIPLSEREAYEGFLSAISDNTFHCDVYWERECRSTIPFLYGVDAQLGGRGRKGHSWDHVAGGLAITIALDSFAHARECTGLSLVVGVSLVTLLHRYGISSRLKWPNDLLESESMGKVGGILIELAEREGRYVPLVGIGINIGSTPENVPEAAGLSLPVSNMACAGFVMAELLAYDARFRQEGIASIESEFMDCVAFLEEPVEFFVGEVRHQGIFKGINAEGWLLVEEGGKENAYHTAEYLRRIAHVTSI
jgi:BirA family biotin operon repressor/biotin-[acetyl-CoA-carboxylase] ligase